MSAGTTCSNKDIYDRFEHWRLARIWVPIVTSDHRVVGTIEAGCNKERMEEVFTQSAIERVKQLGYEQGNTIAATRPQILLRGIAEEAITLIGADSATLHVYRQSPPGSSQTESLEWGELMLAAGAGKATPEFVQSYQPRLRGRGRQAIETRQPVWLDDPRAFKTEYPVLYDRGVRALAVIPLTLGTDTQGILGIHFWRSGKRFTSRELNLANMFGGAMEGVIQNYLLLRRATETGSRAWALSGLQNLMQSLTSPFSLSDVLGKIAKNALLALDADNVILYQYHTDSNSFSVPPVTDGQFMDPASIKVDLSPDDIAFEFVKRGMSQFIVDVREQHELDLATPRKSGKQRFVGREQVKSCAVLVLKSSELGEVVGLLYVNFCKVHNFSDEEKRAMDVLATSAALSIRNAQLHRGDLNRQLKALHEVHAAIAEKGPDLQHVFERLLHQTVNMTGAKYGVCMRWNEDREVLEPVARWPVREDHPIPAQTMEEGIIGLAAKSRSSILVEDVLDHSKSIFIETIGDVRPAKVYKSINSDTRCEIAVPLVDDGHQLLGVLNLEHPEPRALTQDDRVLLQTLAVPAIIAFDTIDLYKRIERRLSHLSALNLIAARVQEKPYDLGTILRLFLTGITAGAGLGFSRAMMFFVDNGRLCGEAAIGAVTQEQAQQAWDRFDRVKATSTADLDLLLREAEEFREETKEVRDFEKSPLSEAIRQLSFPIDYAAGAAAECLANGKTVKITHNQDDPFRKILAEITQPNVVQQAFAAVPLIGKHSGQIGVLIVDNRFLWQERSIHIEDIAGLEAFAGLLALSIETARLQQRLTEERRVENWKEVTGRVAHTVGTLLFEVHGDVKELSSLLQTLHEGVWSDVGPLLGELNNGISKAEKVLLDLRTFASPTALDEEEVDLKQIVTDVFQSVHEDVLIEMCLPDTSLLVLADPFRLSNALREIRKNAREAMSGVTSKPKLIRVTASANRSEATLQAYAQLEITDNGPGFSADVQRRLFEPYFTTKSDGTGLGLAIARKVIAAHGGTLQADNSPDGGAVFVMRIPMVATPKDAIEGVING